MKTFSNIKYNFFFCSARFLRKILQHVLQQNERVNQKRYPRGYRSMRLTLECNRNPLNITEQQTLREIYLPMGGRSPTPTPGSTTDDLSSFLGETIRKQHIVDVGGKGHNQKHDSGWGGRKAKRKKMESPNTIVSNSYMVRP